LVGLLGLTFLASCIVRSHPRRGHHHHPVKRHHHKRH